MVLSESEDLAHSPVSDASSGYISTSISTTTPSDTLVSNIDVKSAPTSESKAQEALKPSGVEEDVDDYEVQVKSGRSAARPRTEEESQENAMIPDVFDSERPAPAPSSLSESSVETEPSVEPTEPVVLPVIQPCSQANQPDPDIHPKATHFSSQTKISDPLAVPKTSTEPLVKQEQTHSTQTPTSNPFKIQKVKASGLKSFRGILQEAEEELDKEGVDPLEKLEILSDTEEGHEEGALPDWMKEDEYVTVGSNKNGTVRYIGPTDFADGIWVGVELDLPAGTLCVCVCVNCCQDTKLCWLVHIGTFLSVYEYGQALRLMK